VHLPVMVWRLKFSRPHRFTNSPYEKGDEVVVAPASASEAGILPAELLPLGHLL
jgi:hypothetical protein